MDNAMVVEHSRGYSRGGATVRHNEAHSVTAGFCGGPGSCTTSKSETMYADDTAMSTKETAVATTETAKVDELPSAIGDSSSRKRPPSKQFAENIRPSLNQRPRIMTDTNTALQDAHSHNALVDNQNQQHVQEAHGLLDFAMQNRQPQQQQPPQPHPNLYLSPTRTSTVQNKKTPQVHYNSMVHLSVVKAAPSYTEPWRKMSPISLTGNGVAIPWSTEQKSGETANKTKNRGTFENDNSSTTAMTTMRILTNARLVQHATCIRARSQQNPTSSTGCTVEWISLAMDLALLRLNAPQNQGADDNTAIQPLFGLMKQAPPLPFKTNLPQLGEEIVCIGFPKMAVSNISALSSFMRHGSFGSTGLHSSNNNASTSLSTSRHADLNMHRGTVAKYAADEEEHFQLRMKINLSIPGNYSEGSLITDGNNNVIGMVASTTSSLQAQESTSIHSVIPGLVINHFLNLCRQKMHHDPSAQRLSAAICSTDGECSSSALCDTADEETSQSERGDQEHTPHHQLLTKGTNGAPNVNAAPPLNAGITYLPDIPTLGIAGFQTLENKALRQSLGLDAPPADPFGHGGGVRILGMNQTAVHPTATVNTDNEYLSSLHTDDVLLAVDDMPIRLDGTVRFAPGRENNERVDFRWPISQRPIGATVKLDVIRQRHRIMLHVTLNSPRYLVPRFDEGGDAVMPSYVICGGCVFVPLTQAWLFEMFDKCQGNPSLGLQGLQRHLQEQRTGDQQIIILSHVLADDVNVGYHGYENMVLTSFNGQRFINNMQHLVDLMVKQNNGQNFEFRCSYVPLDRAKVVICMDAKEVMDSEPRILRNYMIDSWCGNVLSPALKNEAEGKAQRRGLACCLKTMRAVRTSVSETTLVEVRALPKDDDNSAIAATRHIMNFTETHKMQSAPLFAGKYTEDNGWTNVKTKHLSQLCVCGKSTRFYCICTVGVMRCKDCFIEHCRDNSHQHACSKSCAPNCEGGAEVLAEGVGLVTTKKTKTE